MVRNLVQAAAAAFTILMLVAECALGQDLDYVRAIERAQQQRPASIGNSGRIAPAGETGTPMILRGRIVDSDGTPAAGTIVFAYHTDERGLYDRPEAGAHSWRLKGWAKADEQGRFTFETIRPGAYPDRQTPAHVHFTAFAPSGERFHAGEVRFANDPLVSQRDRDGSAKAGDFGEVRPVRLERGVEHVEFTLRIDPAQRL
jgi:protocatechuate 3,4-dioxygenase beta subunit